MDLQQDESTTGSGSRAGAPDPNELEDLRRILLAPDRGRLDEVTERQEEMDRKLGDLSAGTHRLAEEIGDPEKRSSLIAEVLPDALTLRARSDPGRLGRALTPSVEDAIRQSVDQNPGFLAGTLGPIIMPAVKRAIASALEQLVERVNRTIQQRFSVQSLRWRLEAARAGVNYGAYLLAKTVEYRVEQVFLIHKPTGLLLVHVASDPATATDADLISGMLTAIQNFVHDSFGGPEEEALDAMEVGDLKVWVERSAHTALAAVIRGLPPLELRDQLEETSESILARHFQDLLDFEGDSAPFEDCRPVLERCLRARYRDPKEARGTPNKAAGRVLRWVVPLLLLGALSIPVFHFIRTNVRWARYLDRLEIEPGIVVTEHSRLRVSGLRDPLALDPTGLLASFSLDSADVESRWRPYRSLEPDFETRRALATLSPPPSVTWSLTGDTLHLAGEADRAWIAGVDRLAEAFPFLKFDLNGLQVAMTGEVRDLVDRIQEVELRFREGRASLAVGQQRTLDELIDRVETLGRELADIGFRADLEVVGHASEEGVQELNLSVSQQRASYVRDVILGLGIDTTIVRVRARGVGAAFPVSTGNPAEDRLFSRRVTFETVLSRG